MFMKYEFLTFDLQSLSKRQKIVKHSRASRTVCTRELNAGYDQIFVLLVDSVLYPLMHPCFVI